MQAIVYRQRARSLVGGSLTLISNRKLLYYNIIIHFAIEIDKHGIEQTTNQQRRSFE